MLSNYKIKDQTFKMLYKINKSHIEPLLESADLDQTKEIEKLKYLMAEDKESVLKYIKRKNVIDNDTLENLTTAVKYFKSMSELLIKKKYFPAGLDLSLPRELKLNPFIKLSKSNLPFIISAIAMIERNIFSNISDSKEMIQNANKNTQILTSYKSSVSSLPNIKKNIDEYSLFEILNQHLLLVLHSSKIKDKKFNISLFTNYETFKSIIESITINYKSNKGDFKDGNRGKDRGKDRGRDRGRDESKQYTKKKEKFKQGQRRNYQSGGENNSLEQYYKNIKTPLNKNLHEILNEKAINYSNSDPTITVSFKKTAITFDETSNDFKDVSYTTLQKLDKRIERDASVIDTTIRQITPRKLTEQIRNYNIQIREYIRRELNRYKKIYNNITSYTNSTLSGLPLNDKGARILRDCGTHDLTIDISKSGCTITSTGLVSGNDKDENCKLAFTGLQNLDAIPSVYNFENLARYILNVYRYEQRRYDTDENKYDINEYFLNIPHTTSNKIDQDFDTLITTLSTSPTLKNISNFIILWEKIKDVLSSTLDRNVIELMELYIRDKVYKYIRSLPELQKKPINTLLKYIILTNSKYEIIKKLLGLTRKFNNESKLDNITNLYKFAKTIIANKSAFDVAVNNFKTADYSKHDYIKKRLSSDSIGTGDMGILSVLNLINFYGPGIRNKIIDDLYDSNNSIGFTSNKSDVKKEFDNIFTSKNNNNNFKINNFVLQNVLSKIENLFNPIVLEYYIQNIITELKTNTKINTIIKHYGKLIGTLKQEYKSSIKKYNPLLFFENIYNGSYLNASQNFISLVLDDKEDDNINTQYNEIFYPKLKDGMYFDGNKKYSEKMNELWNKCKSKNKNKSKQNGGDKKKGKNKCSLPRYKFVSNEVNNYWKFKKVSNPTGSFTDKQLEDFLLGKESTTIINNSNNNNNNTDKYNKIRIADNKVELYNGVSWTEVKYSIEKIDKLEVKSIKDDLGNKLPMELLKSIKIPETLIHNLKIIDLFKNDNNHSKLINIILKLKKDLKKPGGYKYLFNKNLITKKIFEDFYSFNVLSLMSLYCYYEHDIFKKQMFDFADHFSQYKVINKRIKINNNTNNFKTVKQTKKQKVIQLMNSYKLEIDRRVLEIDRKIKRSTNLQTEQQLQKEKNDLIIKFKKVQRQYKNTI